MTPEGVGQPMNCLRGRFLARHIHAMLKGGVTLVTVHLEPGMRASGLNLWLLEVLAACSLCFDGSWIAMGDWNMEPHELSQAGWLNTVCGKVFATSAVTCAGGAGAVLDYFVVSEAMAHLVQQAEVVHNSPTTPHWPVRLTLKATSWGHRVLARRRPKPFLVGPRRDEESFVWTWAAEEIPDDQKLAWLEWLRAAEAAWCRVHDFCGAQGRPFSGQEQRAGHRARFPCPGYAQGRQEGLQQEGGGMARAPAHRCPGTRRNAQLKQSPQLHRAVASEKWTDLVRRVMLFITNHTQQAVNVSAAESARGWRQWAIKAC